MGVPSKSRRIGVFTTLAEGSSCHRHLTSLDSRGEVVIDWIREHFADRKLPPLFLSKYDAIIVRLNSSPRMDLDDVIGRTKQLFVCNFSVGTNHLSSIHNHDMVKIFSGGTLSTPESHLTSNADGVAELALSLMNGLLRPWHLNASNVVGGEYHRDAVIQATRIEGKSYLILGAGTQSKALIPKLIPYSPSRISVWNRTMDAARLNACLTRVSGTSTPEGTDESPQSHVLGTDGRRIPVFGYGGLDRLNDALGQADLVSLHLPYVPPNQHTIGTIGLVDDARLRAMACGSRLVNVGRGELVDEGAIIAHLKSKHLGGYASDVLSAETERHKSVGLSPVWKYWHETKDPRVILTAHIGGQTDIDCERVANGPFGDLLSALDLPPLT